MKFPIDNYDQFVDEIIKLQRDKSEGGVGLTRTLNRKRIVLKRYNISINEHLWNIPLEILQSILDECRKKK